MQGSGGGGSSSDDLIQKRSVILRRRGIQRTAPGHRGPGDDCASNAQKVLQVLRLSANYSYDVSVTERLPRVCQVVSIGLGDQIEGFYAGTRMPPGRLRSKQGNENPDEDSDSGQKRRVPANH
jgi:hypothetical protein